MGALKGRRTRAALFAIGLLGLASCGPPDVDELPTNAPSVTAKSVVETRATTTLPIFTPTDSVPRPSPNGTKLPTTLPAQTSSPATGETAAAPTAICNDGTYWYVAQHQGACSQHGGVAVFYR
jgi:Protein of unknown function (DUF3761)